MPVLLYINPIFWICFLAESKKFVKQSSFLNRRMICVQRVQGSKKQSLGVCERSRKHLKHFGAPFCASETGTPSSGKGYIRPWHIRLKTERVCSCDYFLPVIRLASTLPFTVSGKSRNPPANHRVYRIQPKYPYPPPTPQH